jgi:surfactin synthase thioesterase subunit
MSARPWFVGRPPAAVPRVRLYCFPHSGGSTGEYLRWAGALPGVHVLGVNLPGRAARIAEPPLTSVPALVSALLDAAVFETPCVFFGHSFGALLAYEVARELAVRGRESPGRVVLSAYPPPHQPQEREPMSDLPDEALFAAIDERYGGLPGELRSDPELMALVVPAYRADLAALETYRHRPGPPLDIPLDVFAGERDDVAPPEHLAEWRQYTTAAFRLHRFPGGHFYFRQEPGAPLATLATLLTAPATAPTPAPAPADPPPPAG